MSSDEQAIRMIQTKWIDATARGDREGLLALMAPDIVFLTPGRPPFGLKEFMQGFESFAGKTQFSGNAEFEEVVVVGDVAYARGKLAISMTPKGGATMKLAGYTLSVFRKQPAGYWVLARDANFVAPLPEAAP